MYSIAKVESQKLMAIGLNGQTVWGHTNGLSCVFDLSGAALSCPRCRPYFEERYRCNQQLQVSEILPAPPTPCLSVVFSRCLVGYYTLSLPPPANEAAHCGLGAARDREQGPLLEHAASAREAQQPHPPRAPEGPQRHPDPDRPHAGGRRGSIVVARSRGSRGQDEKVGLRHAHARVRPPRPRRREQRRGLAREPARRKRRHRLSREHGLAAVDRREFGVRPFSHSSSSSSSFSTGGRRQRG